MQSRLTYLAGGLAVFQLVDALATSLLRQHFKDQLDHLGVPENVRVLLPLIKVSTSAGLLLGLRIPRIGALTSAALVAYYAAAIEFHLLAKDHPAVSLPAVAFGSSAAVALLGFSMVFDERSPHNRSARRADICSSSC